MTPLIMLTTSSASESLTEIEDMAIDTSVKTVPEILAVCASADDSDNSLTAAQALRDTAEKLDISIRIEVHKNGSIIDELAPEQIAECKGVIVATDTNIVLKRFAEKQVLVTTTSQAINEPEKLIRKILNHEAPVAETGIAETLSDQKEIPQTKVQPFIRLMESLSSIMPVLVAGSFMLTAAMLLAGDLTSLSLFFKAVGNSVLDLFVLLLAAFIAWMIAGKDAAAIGFIGGAVANAGYSLNWLADQNAPLSSSGIPGALIAGAAAGFTGLILQKLCFKMPSSLRLIKTNIIYPIIGTLLISLVMLALNAAVSDINTIIVKALESIGLDDKILPIIILIVLLVMNLITPHFIRKQDDPE